MGTFPEFGPGTLYESAINSSPIARAFILEPQDSEVFLKAIGALGEEMEARHPRFELRIIEPLIIVGQSLGVFIDPDGEDIKDEWEEIIESMKCDVEALFFMGYELGTKAHINELFSYIFSRACEFGYIDINEVDRTIAENFVDMVLRIGVHYRNVDNNKPIDKNAQNPVIAVDPPPKAGSPYDEALKNMWKD